MNNQALVVVMTADSPLSYCCDYHYRSGTSCQAPCCSSGKILLLPLLSTEVPTPFLVPQMITRDNQHNVAKWQNPLACQCHERNRLIEPVQRRPRGGFKKPFLV